jgi:competence protein ComEC
VSLLGRFHYPVAGDGLALFEAEEAGCRRPLLRARVPGPVEAGQRVHVEGTWRVARGPGMIVATSVEVAADGRWSLRWALVRWRGHLTRRLEALYGPRAPLVVALTLARMEGIDPELREAFARSGTAHILSISGFHVAVIAALLLPALRAAGLRRRAAALAAAGGVWLYVALLGFPDAACRAALMLATVALSKAGGRPPARWGALGSSLLVLAAQDPQRLASPGFQLSFAGVAGLIGWSPGVGAWLERVGRGRAPRFLTSSVAASVAATLATLPFVASLAGIPATLVASPLVALALPGAIASVAADALHPATGRFLAGGVDLVLLAFEEVTRRMAEPAWASVWVPRAWVPVAASGGLIGLIAASRSRVRRKVRAVVGFAGGVALVGAWPILLTLQSRGTVELLMLDVGQGDAIALRTPRGRWLLVDAGPPGGEDPGAHPVVRELRRRGVTRLELLVLTHAHLDHVGGAADVLTTFEVGGILEPARPTGSQPYVELLELATRLGVPWRAAWDGQRTEIDGVVLEVLHPPAGGVPGDIGPVVEGSELNATSVVLAVHFGAFDALLAGDAPAEVERVVSDGYDGGVEVLKVAHHGSATSSDSLFLARTRPGLAMVSSGRGNRYGHPAPEALARLRAAGVEVRRTDQEGTIRILARPDGSWSARGARERGR